MFKSNNPFELEKTPLISFEKENQNNKEIAPQFNPYSNNGGNVAVVQGKDYVVVAGDTRLSLGYGVLSRDTSKIVKLTDKCILVSSGMYADFLALKKHLQAKIVMYEFDNGKKPSVKACAQLLGTTLYHKRFFPYYCFTAIAGIDEDGKGISYGYDAVGGFQPIPYGAQGSASQFLTPAMDQVLDGYNNKNHKKPEGPEEVVDFLRDIFNAAAERDIQTGDNVEILILRNGKEPEYQKFDLRLD